MQHNGLPFLTHSPVYLSPAGQENALTEEVEHRPWSHTEQRSNSSFATFLCRETLNSPNVSKPQSSPLSNRMTKLMLVITWESHGAVLIKHITPGLAQPTQLRNEGNLSHR